MLLLSWRKRQFCLATRCFAPQNFQSDHQVSAFSLLSLYLAIETYEIHSGKLCLVTELTCRLAGLFLSWRIFITSSATRCFAPQNLQFAHHVFAFRLSLLYHALEARVRSRYSNVLLLLFPPLRRTDHADQCWCTQLSTVVRVLLHLREQIR